MRGHTVPGVVRLDEQRAPNARAKADPPAAPSPSLPKDPSPLTTGVALHSLVPPQSALGNEWADDGDQPSSLDLDSPPPSCAPFTHGFDGRVDELVHEFSFLPTADGNSEQGHIGMNAVQARSAAAVSDELATVGESVVRAVRGRHRNPWFHRNREMGRSTPSRNDR